MRKTFKRSAAIVLTFVMIVSIIPTFGTGQDIFDTIGQKVNLIKGER